MKALIIETPRWTYYKGRSIRKLTSAINKTIRDPRRRLWAQGFSYASKHSKSKMYKGYVLHAFATDKELEDFIETNHIKDADMRTTE